MKPLAPTILTVPCLDEPERRVMAQGLPLPPEDYRVAEVDGMWFVTVAADGGLIYAGPGPVTVEENIAPF